MRPEGALRTELTTHAQGGMRAEGVALETELTTRA